MSGWMIALYAIAAFLAIRSLVELMTKHRIRHQYDLIAKMHEEAEAAESAKAEAEAAENGDQDETEKAA